MKFKIIVFAFAFISLAFSQEVTVEAFDEQQNNSSHLTLRLRVLNNSLDTLRDVRVRYFLNYEKGRNLNISPYYLAGANISVDTLGTLLAIDIETPILAPGFFPNQSGICFGLNYTDNEEFHKDENFSYPDAKTFVSASNILLYVEGSLVFGTSPVDEGIPKLRIMEFQPENGKNQGAWIKIKNIGKQNVFLKYIFLQDSSNTQRYELTDKDRQKLFSQDSVVLCVSSPCKEGVYLKNISLGNSGELILGYGSNWLDYVAWGKEGNKSIKAMNYGVWSKNKDYIKTKRESFGPSLPYKKGNFFRRMISDEFSSLSWLPYSENEFDALKKNLPNSVPFSWNNGSRIVLPANKALHFAWVPVLGAKSYQLKIYSEDSLLIYQKETNTTFADVFIPDGKYLWGVESKSDTRENFLESNAIVSSLFSVERISESVDYQDSFTLNVIPFAARKDTRLLVPNWGMYADVREWDQSHVGKSHWDEEEAWRCWVVGIQTLNYYFGGNLTQDEIKIHGMNERGNSDWILGVFPLASAGGGSQEVVQNTLSWALGNISINYYEETPSDSLVRAFIKNGLPLYVGTNSHIMVMDAYRVRGDGQMEVRFLNPHNDGESEWQIFSSAGIVHYWTYEKPLQVLNADSLVFKDSDEDGLVDYDEIYRFHTNPNNEDSDGDGINDKVEIWSYTIRETPNRKQAYSDSMMNPIDMQNGTWILGVEKELFADADNDGIRAELDVDSDDDGLLDGKEDLNKNGIIEEGETDPYIADVFKRPVYAEDDVPGNFALYSLGKISLNDGSSCRFYKSYQSVNSCSFASESESDYFSLSLAAKNRINLVHSKGGVLVRNRDTVNFVYIYSDKDKKPSLNIQKGASALGFAYVSNENWPWSVNRELETFDVGSETKIIRSGEELFLSDGAKYETLKIESGGILRLGTGNVKIGNLQLEAGSFIEFTSLGSETILQAKNSIIWRSQIIPKISNNYYATRRNLSAAKGFKLIYQGTETAFIEGEWAGTIYAPYARLVLGQANKNIFGRFMGNGITIHQYAKLYAVPFEPNSETAVVLQKGKGL